MQLKRNVEELKDTCNNIFSFMQSRLGNYTPPLQPHPPLEEIVPDFEVLKSALSSYLQSFAYEYMTNPTVISLERLSSKKKSKYRGKFDKQKIMIETIGLN